MAKALIGISHFLNIAMHSLSLARFQKATLSLIACLGILTSISHADELTYRKLFDPKPDFPYFASMASIPLSQTPSEFEVTDAAFLAELCLLSYVRQPEITKSHLKRIGFDQIAIVDTEGTYAIAASSPIHSVVVFRGTERGDATDFMTDIKVAAANYKGKGHVHSGFLQALDRARPALSGFLKDHHDPSRQQLWIAGHSMGASLAILFGIDRREDTPIVYTYGAPRTVGQKFDNDAIPPLLYRIFNDNDIVPKLVPKPFYRHVGDNYLITSEGSLLNNPESMEKWKSHFQGHREHLKKIYQNYWKKGRFDALPSDYLVDHAPISYVTMLKRSAIPEH